MTEKMGKCLVCRQDGEPLLKSTTDTDNDDSEMNKIHRSWAKTCINSVCTLIKLPDFQYLFLNANYCQVCLQLITNIDVSLQQINNLQKQILGFREHLFTKFGENYEETEDDDIKTIYEKIDEDSQSWTSTDFMDTEAPKNHQRIRNVLDVVKIEANDENESMEFYDEETAEKFIPSSRPQRKRNNKVIYKEQDDANKDNDVIKEEPLDEPDMDSNEDNDSDWNCSDADSAAEESNVYVPELVFGTEKKSRRKKNPKRSKDKVSDKQFQCEVPDCIYKCDLESALRDHQRKVHEGDPTPYHCQVCDKKFRSSSNLSEHKKIHLRTAVPCSECNKKCRSEEYLKKHMANFHSILFKCKFCSMVCETKEQLDEHENAHKNSDKPFTCTICDEVFTNSILLKQHMLTHDEGRPICDVCGKSFRALRYLQRHRKVHDESYVGFPCTVCNKKLPSPSDLKRHMEIHSDAKNYICDVCGEGFKQNAVLRIHKRKHDGDFKFVCQICGKKFTSSQLLKSHEEIHSGTLSYECKICGKKFRALKNLRQHEKGHEPKDPNKKKKIRANPMKLSSQAKKIKTKGNRPECEFEADSDDSIEENGKKSSQHQVQEHRVQIPQYPSTSTQQFQPEYYANIMPHFPFQYPTQ